VAIQSPLYILVTNPMTSLASRKEGRNEVHVTAFQKVIAT